MRSSSVERLIALRAFPGFQAVATESLAPMARYTTDREFAAGDVIFAEGAPVATMHFVLDGEVEVSRSGMPFRRIHAGQSFGALAALAGVQEGVTARATRPTRTLELSIENLETVLLEHFDLMAASLQAVSYAAMQARKTLPGGGYDTDAKEGKHPPREMSLIDRLVHLKEAIIISKHRVDALMELARTCVEWRVEPGQTLWKLGDPPGLVAQIVAGVIKCTAATGAEFRFGEGAFVGAMDAISDDGRWFEAVAETPVTALCFDINDFIDIMEDHTYMALDLLRGIADDLFEVLGQRRSYADDDSPL